MITPDLDEANALFTQLQTIRREIVKVAHRVLRDPNPKNLKDLQIRLDAESNLNDAFRNTAHMIGN
jgi:hypothetical protein